MHRILLPHLSVMYLLPFLQGPNDPPFLHVAAHQFSHVDHYCYLATLFKSYILERSFCIYSFPSVFNSVMPLLGICIQNIKTLIYTPVFNHLYSITTVGTIARTWEKSKCLTIGERIPKLCYIYTMEC